MSELILVINCGSSIKFALFDAASTIPDRKPICSKSVSIAGPGS